MKTVLKLAWRNLWRNTRRTLLTVLAIAFAIALTVFARGVAFGTYQQSINYNVMLSLGHIQIHGDGYWDKQILRNSFEVDQIDTAWIAGLPNVTVAAPKLAMEALVAIGEENSSGARIEGVDPVREHGVSIIPTSIVAGRWLEPSDSVGIVIGSVLAKNIEASVGDTLVYFTQGYYGTTSAGLHPVVGVFRTGSQQIDAAMAYLPVHQFQKELDAEGRLTALAVVVDDYRAVPRTLQTLSERYSGDDFEVMDYAELLPDIMSSIAFDKASGVVFIIIIIVIASFSILETILMSVMERFHEFGVMRAIGMRRRMLVGLIMTEAFLIACIGSIVGNAIGYAANAYLRAFPFTVESWKEMTLELGFTPEIIAMVDPADQLLWTTVIFGLTLVGALWPARVATRFSPVEAIRQT